MGLFDKEKEVVTATGETVLVKKESFWERIKACFARQKLMTTPSHT